MWVKKGGAKKGIVQRPPAARRPAPNAEDFVMRLVQQPPERRREMLANNQRFQRLPRKQRQKVLDRLEQIDKMKPAERAQLIERYHLFSRLEPAKRERARELYVEWGEDSCGEAPHDDASRGPPAPPRSRSTARGARVPGVHQPL